MALLAALVGLLGAAGPAAYFADHRLRGLGASCSVNHFVSLQPDHIDLGHIRLQGHAVRGHVQVLARFLRILDVRELDLLLLSGSGQPHLQGGGSFHHGNGLCDFLHVVDRASRSDDHLGAEQPFYEHHGHVQVLRHSLRSHLRVLARLELIQLVPFQWHHATRCRRAGLRPSQSKRRSAPTLHLPLPPTPSQSLLRHRSSPANLSNPIASSSATFTYSDSQSGATFKCSLDSASYSSCASTGITYTGLADGTHTFSVEAKLGSGSVSSPATYSWRVDTTPPTIDLMFPNVLGVYNAASLEMPGARRSASAAQPLTLQVSPTFR